MSINLYNVSKTHESFFYVHFTYHLNNAGEQSPREAIRSWKRHVYPLTWGAEMSMDGEGYVPKLPRKRQIPRRKPRGTCRVVGWEKILIPQRLKMKVCARCSSL